jgi:hypothetical protein
MMELSENQIAELSSLAETNKDVGGPTFMGRHHWRGFYDGLVRAGLVSWGDPPQGFGRKYFAGAEVTEKGKKYLAGSIR